MNELGQRPDCDICEITSVMPPELVIIDGDHWIANLRENDQTLLGTSFITAKRHVSELDRLLPDEDEEFVFIRNGLLRAIRKTFEPITFNISCLKNDAFKADPDNTPSSAAHVHYHIKPRYGTALKVFSDEIFRDPVPGRYLNQGERKMLDFGQLTAIANAIRENLSKK